MGTCLHKVIFFKKWAIAGLFFFIFVYSTNSKSCRWLVSNRGPLVLEAAALPTETQPLPKRSSYPSSSDAWQIGHGHLLRDQTQGLQMIKQCQSEAIVNRQIKLETQGGSPGLVVKGGDS